jgi:uncharacterized delta-60 repeat protein
MRNYYSSKLAILVYLLLLPILGWGQGAGDLDTSFRTGTGPYGNITATKILPNGKILITGNFTNYQGVSRNGIARLNADGSIDTSFNPGTGLSGGSDGFIGNSLALQSDGKIIVAGQFSSCNGFGVQNIARIHTDGRVDTTFYLNFYRSEPVTAMAIQNDDKIIIGGRNGYHYNIVKRLNPNGRLDTTFHIGYVNYFGSGDLSSAYSIAIQSDGKIIVGGYFNYYDYQNARSIIRLNINGTIDTNFQRDVPLSYVSTLAIQEDGKILIGTSPSSWYNNGNTININRLTRLNNNGSLDMLFNPTLGGCLGGSNSAHRINAIAIQPNGNILVGGYFDCYNNNIPRNGIARIKNDGNLDTVLVSYPNNSSWINALSIQPDKKIIVSGTFTTFNGISAQGIVRIFGCTTPPTPTISGTPTICQGGSTILTSSSATGNIWSTGDTTQSITVNTAGNYTVWRVSGDCTSAASSPTEVSTIICNQIFTGDGLFTNTDRWLGGSIPNTGTDITVRGIMTLTSSVSLRNVNIENGGIVVPSGLTLTVTGNLSNQGVISGGGAVRLTGANNQEFGGGTISNLVVDNSATVIQNAATQISGSITLGNNQVLDLNNLSFSLLSTATHTAQLAQVPANSSITNGANFTVQRWLNRSFLRRGALANGNYYFLGPVVQGQTMNLWNSVSRYNNQTFSGSGVGNLYLYNPTSNNWYKPSSASTSLPVGAGVQVWFGSTTFFSVRNEWSATGAPQVGDYNLPITPNQGFQLLSNPYPSTIDWDSPNWTKANVSNAIYIYDWVNRRYKSYIDGLGANGGSRYLPTAQGFIVRAESNSPVLTAREGIKVSNQVALQRTENQASSVIRLQTRRGSMTDEVVIAHRPNSQLAFEPQVDARKMMNPATNIFIAGTVRQSIASMDLNAATVIPIELLSDSTGMVTLSTTEFSGLSGGPYYLVDEITTEVYPYTPQTSYQFYLNANEPYSLSLRLNNVNGISDFKANVFEVYPNPATDKVTIKTVGTGTLEILNTLGQAVITQPATATKEINVSKLAKGIYTVRFNGVSKLLVVK